MNIKSIKQLKMKDLKGRRVLVRCDFDVPIKKIRNKKLEIRNNIADDTRLKALIPTIGYLVKKKAKVVLIGHLGRPGGKFDSNLSLEIVAKRLEDLLNKEYQIKNTEKIPNTQYPISKKYPIHNIQYQNIRGRISRITNYQLPITFINDCIGPKVEKVIGEMKESEVLVLENLRFYIGERKNDDKFAGRLAKLADIYVNEAFANSHRAHVSMDVIKNYLPGFAGLRLREEIENLGAILKRPSRPLVFVIGGAKVETKLPVIDNFLFRADYVLCGGVVANNFLKAAGFEIGRSKYDKKYLKKAKRILEKEERGLLGKNTEYRIKNIEKISNFQFPISNFDNIGLKEIERLKKKVVVPVDAVVSQKHKNTKTQKQIKLINEVGRGDSILDIGPRTVKLYERIIRGARTIVWNGPMGWFEDERFADGTESIAKAVIDSRAKVVIGGGESVDAVKDLLGVKINELPKRVFVSMAGGAMLELLAGEKLPGLRGLVRF